MEYEFCVNFVNFTEHYFFPDWSTISPYFSQIGTLLLPDWNTTSLRFEHYFFSPRLEHYFFQIGTLINLQV